MQRGSFITRTTNKPRVPFCKHNDSLFYPASRLKPHPSVSEVFSKQPSPSNIHTHLQSVARSCCFSLQHPSSSLPPPTKNSGPKTFHLSSCSPFSSTPPLPLGFLCLCPKTEFPKSLISPHAPSFRVLLMHVHIRHKSFYPPSLKAIQNLPLFPISAYASSILPSSSDLTSRLLNDSPHFSCFAYYTLDYSWLSDSHVTTIQILPQNSTSP